MPVYEYLCEKCGPFTEVRPMRQSAKSQPCPGCDRPAARAFLSMPHVGGMSAEQRLAHATNEQSAHEPKAAGHRHGPGCGCAYEKSGGKKRAAKGFPGRRPWMISH